ncbi:MAG: aryl-sulfate sulfotransferase, partial [Bacteroidota bacterium]
MRSHLLLFVLFLCSFRSSAQTGIQLNTSEALESYTLIENNIGTYLIDNCGEVVNYWDTPTTDLHPKLLPNGDLLYITFGAIEVVDWNGLYVKGLYHGDPDLELVYEVIPLENGNYLSLGRRDFSIEQFEAIGYNYGSGNPSSPTVVDVVVELDGQTGDIVWEWNISDHVIQERDANAPNYGSISSSPELLDLDAIEIFDWTFYESFMINGMDYNPDLDQIALSVRKISEVIIIDHSTTTEEAAGHTG